MPGPASTKHQAALLKIYAHYDGWAGQFAFACERGCATCCTQSVTMTTLEGALIYEYICKRPDLMPLLDLLPDHTPFPATTTNQFALACLQERVTDEEQHAWDLSPCLFLRENCCLIYPVRPFMCRSFGSRVKCALTGSAEIEPLFLTLNTVIMQCIEHLDRGRPWGNLNTILRFTADKGDRPALLSQPVPGFLIPPGEADLLHARMSVLLEIIKEAA